MPRFDQTPATLKFTNTTGTVPSASMQWFNNTGFGDAVLTWGTYSVTLKSGNSFPIESRNPGTTIVECIVNAVGTEVEVLYGEFSIEGMGGGGSGGSTTAFSTPDLRGSHYSPVHFAAAYASASTLLITGGQINPSLLLINNAQIAGVFVSNVNDTYLSSIYLNGIDGYHFALNTTTGILTAYKAGVAVSIFTNNANEKYSVHFNFGAIASDANLNTVRSLLLNPDSNLYLTDDIVDTTDIAAATNYYPSANGIETGYNKFLSFTGKLIDADGTITLYLEGTNDEDATSANRDWIKVYGYDTKNNVIVNQFTVTDGSLTFAIDFDDFNYRYYRIAVVTSGATNTVIVKGRRRY